jgi:hypothetical protein
LRSSCSSSYRDDGQERLYAYVTVAYYTVG